MGFSYFDGLRWVDITREERFFCQRLYELVRFVSVSGFAQYVSEKCGLNLPLAGEWELAYEVCFYRDFRSFRRNDSGFYSPKRTFDLCLFGESSIVIIEAKAAVAFSSDQNLSFAEDVERVREKTGIADVHLVGLCSSLCKLDEETARLFGGRMLRWRELAALYGNDAILQRADGVYTGTEWSTGYGRNSDVKMSGRALVEAFRGGASWWVGRGGGGAEGERFLTDARTGRWRTQVYEVNTSADGPPSSNYFSLQDFVRAVDQLGEPLDGDK